MKVDGEGFRLSLKIFFIISRLIYFLYCYCVKIVLSLYRHTVNHYNSYTHKIHHNNKILHLVVLSMENKMRFEYPQDIILILTKLQLTSLHAFVFISHFSSIYY